MNTYTVVSNEKETKPFQTFEEAKQFALAWKGKFSNIVDLEVHEDGKLLEVV